MLIVRIKGPKYMLSLGFFRRGINTKEDVRLWTSQASYDCEGWGRYADEEYLLSWQSRGQKVCFIIQSDAPGNSIDKDMHCEHIRQMGAGKYQRESCYHRIECSATNSLVTLMTKWYLNSSFQPYSYSPKISRRCWCDNG